MEHISEYDNWQNKCREIMEDLGNNHPLYCNGLPLVDNIEDDGVGCTGFRSVYKESLNYNNIAINEAENVSHRLST